MTCAYLSWKLWHFAVKYTMVISLWDLPKCSVGTRKPIVLILTGWPLHVGFIHNSPSYWWKNSQSKFFSLEIERVCCHIGAIYIREVIKSWRTEGKCYLFTGAHKKQHIMSWVIVMRELRCCSQLPKTRVASRIYSMNTWQAQAL